MRIESIEIKNFRQYKHAMYIFTKRDKHDLHIIKGKNGMGKTNLLNAISWCLYNEEAHLGKDNSREPRINIDALNEARNNNLATCTINVCITISDNGKNIIFNRKQIVETSNIFEYRPEFTVTVMENEDDTIVYSDEETVDNYVNMYLPYSIREYFFFDGEQLDKYFIDKKANNIKDAIQVISQVKLLTSMKDRLGKLIRELQTEAGKKNKDIDSLLKKISDLKKNLDNQQKIINEKERQIELSSKKIEEYSSFLRGKEGIPDKEKEFEELQKYLKKLNEDKHDLTKELHKFICRYKVLFVMFPAIEQTYSIICKKENEGAFPPRIDKGFLKRMLQKHKCLVCNRDLNEEDEVNLENLLNTISLSSRQSNILSSIKGQLEELIDETKMYKNKKEDIFKRKQSIEKESYSVEARLQKIDEYLKSYSDRDKIAEYHTKRLDHDNLIKNNIKAITRLQIEVDNITKQLKSTKDQLEKDLEARSEFEEINNKIKFATKANNIVTEIEEEMLDEARGRMKCETMSIFKKLEWKKEAFSHIELDDLYNLELYDNYGFATLGTCSAGERALLALSFTLALQKVAGYNSMVFIDTPVGRIDSENRANFAEVLKKVSIDKQVIITFTTSEYSKEIQEVFESIASTFIELQSETSKVTKLCGGDISE